MPIKRNQEPNCNQYTYNDDLLLNNKVLNYDRICIN